MAAVPAEGLEGCSGGAIGDVDLAVACAAADQQAGLVGGVLEETEVTDRAVVHRQLDFLAWKGREIVRKRREKVFRGDSRLRNSYHTLGTRVTSRKLTVNDSRFQSNARETVVKVVACITKSCEKCNFEKYLRDSMCLR